MTKHWHKSGDKESWADDLKALANHKLPNVMRLTKDEIVVLTLIAPANAHNDLVKALEALLPLAETAPDYVDPGYQWTVDAVLNARRLIAKAKGT